MNHIDEIRVSVVKFLAIILWAHIPIVLIASLTIGQESIFLTLALTVIVAAMPTAMIMTNANDDVQRLMVAISLVLMAAIMVFLFRGHPWQIDIHMYFFAVLAMLSALCDPRAILFSAGVIATHHLLFNIIVPSWVFPEGGDILRVILHAVIVVFETAVLFWLTSKIVEAFKNVQAAEEVAAAETETAKKTAVAAEAATLEAQANLNVAKEAQNELERVAEQAAGQRETMEQLAADERGQIAADFDETLSGMLAEVTEVTSQLEEETNLLRSIASDAESAMSVASSATNNVTGNVNSVASSAEEMSASVNEISRQVSGSSSVAAQALEYAQHSEKCITALSERANKINNALKMIGDIAEQTNLLALNATIEAARAGDAGKGFAVVANEVKSLANQSASATEEIGKLLAGIRDATTDAVDVNAKIVTVVGEISQNSAGIAAAVEEQSAATEEIARAAQSAAGDTGEANSSVMQLNEVSSQVSAVAENTAEAVQSLAEKTANLSDKADKFIATMRM